MKRYTFIVYFLVFLLTSVSNAQIVRTQAMGGLTFSITDKDYVLNPYDLDGNPAWLINDEKSDYLEITPSVSSLWGDYKRLYDPSLNNFYELMFEGVKTLGTNGTFLGQTTYEYDYRRDVYRTLRYNTYSGSAFFINDTTQGNFRYNGPAMKFMYSFEPLENFYFGATAKYKILDGLKSIYTRAQTLYREIYGDVGFAYDFGSDVVAGLKFSINDDQESIEASSEDLLDVDIYNFKGETFSIRKRGSSVEEKFKTLNYNLSGQFCFKPFDNSEVAIIGGASTGHEKRLIPYTISSTNQSFKEYEDGYANFDSYNVLLVGRYYLSNAVILALKGVYDNSSSWSRNSTLDLRLWEWEINDFGAGVGGSYKLSNDLLIGAEYEFLYANIDSSKYVDSRFNTIDATCHLARIGVEYSIVENVYLRLGYNFSITKKDETITNDSEISYHKFTIGTGLKLFDTFSIDAYVEYYRKSVDLNNSIHRSMIDGIVTVTLFTF